MRAAAGLRALLLGALLCACTKDFSRFKFRDLPPLPRIQDAGVTFVADANSGAPLAPNRVDGGAQGGDRAAAAGRSGASAGGPAGGAGGVAGPASATGGRPAGDEDAGAPHDAAMPRDAASQPSTPVDAGPTTEQQCLDGAHRELADITDGCTSCACDQCATSTLACVSQGDSVYDQRCSDLLKCALRNGCRDWDCYCKTTACRTSPDAEAAGPCVTEMNLAAGDSQDHAAVIAAHAPGAVASALTLAVTATTCISGAPRSGSSPAVAGRCENACELP
jgi:hypothetical protein